MDVNIAQSGQGSAPTPQAPSSAWARLLLARQPGRPGTAEFIEALFTDFFEQKGDRSGKEDPSILGGIAYFHGVPVTVVGHRKGKNLEENLRYNFGMPGPEGYKKALRLFAQAEKFHRPVITFIDTPGAYPGKEAEENGQSRAIAANLAFMSRMTVPILSVVTGEGSSGGALAIGVCNTLLMLENAVYSVLSPEGFASILWKDAARAKEAAEVMRITTHDLMRLGVADEIIPEAPEAVYQAVDRALWRHLQTLQRKKGDELRMLRYKKYRRMGASIEQAPGSEVR